MKTKLTTTILGASLLFAMGCKKEPKQEPEQKEEVAVVTVPGINLDYMDPNTKPNDDFFKYVNGKWLENTEIPDDR